MTRYFRWSLLTLTCAAGTLTTSSNVLARDCWYGTVQYAYRLSVGTASTAAPASRVVYAQVQQTPQYDLRRPEYHVGARVTLFVNFLGTRQGCVMLNMDGVSLKCQIVKWKPDSVTLELPKVGLSEPKNVEIVILLPDGRIAKNVPALFINPPSGIEHAETVPQPTLPVPGSNSPAFVN